MTEQEYHKVEKATLLTAAASMVKIANENGDDGELDVLRSSLMRKAELLTEKSID